MTSSIISRENYESFLGGWADGRLGQAYDLIDAVRQEQNTEHDIDAMLKRLGEDIEAADIEIGRFK